MDKMKLVCVFLVPLSLLSLGCGSGAGPETIAVTGTVTYDGVPVADGDIIFRDATGQTRSCGGRIIDGKYSFDASPGSKTVEITAMRDVPGKMDTQSNPGESVPLREMYIPAKYNTETTLTAEVNDSGDPIDFPLAP